MPTCCVVGCNSLGDKKCSACGLVSYCSVSCQMEDWKAHKHLCVDVNNLPTTFLSLDQINKYIPKLNAKMNALKSAKKFRETIDYAEKLLAFLEHQYGVQVQGKSYRRRSNGDQVDNSQLYNLRLTICALYDMVDDPHKAAEYATIARQMLEHRDKSAYLNLVALSEMERVIAVSCIGKQQYVLADHHCEQCLKFALLITGREARLSSEHLAYRTFATLRTKQSRDLEATNYSEKAYILLSETYGPIHPEVQGTAIQLIQCLIDVGDLIRAENYCRMNYENLTDPRYGLDQESSDIAIGMCQLSTIWLHKDPLDDEKAAFALAEEAEEMIRKACIITEEVYGIDSLIMAKRHQVYGGILIKRGKFTDETRIVLKRSLHICHNQKGEVPLDPLIKSLKLLGGYHEHVSRNMPEGKAKSREIRIGNKYLMELGPLVGIMPDR